MRSGAASAGAFSCNDIHEDSDCAMNIVILYGARLAWRIDVITTCGVLLQSFVYASTSHVTTLPCYGDGCIGSGFESMFAVS